MKISTEGIQGFAEMSTEQQLAAVLAMDMPDPVDMSQYVERKTFDAKASEAAELSRKLKGRMTEEEAAAAERAAELDGLKAQMAALQADNEKLQRERTESLYKAKYLAMPGFDEALAEETARAMAAGQMEKVFENQQKANEAYKKQVQAELVKGDPKPSGAGGEGDNEPDNVKWARDRAKQRAEAMKAGNNAMNKYKI